MNQISLALGHWGTGSRSNDFQGAPPKWMTGPPGQPSGTSSEHQPSATDRRQVFLKLWVFHGLTPKPLGKPMKSPLKSPNVRIWGSRCFHISRTPWQASFAIGNSGAGDVVLQQGGIFVCQLYTVVKEGLVSLSDSLLGMESG